MGRKRWFQAGAFAGNLVVVVRLVDHGLAGSGLVLALIGATMYLTRRIDWYAFGASVPPELPTSAEHTS